MKRQLTIGLLYLSSVFLASAAHSQAGPPALPSATTMVVKETADARIHTLVNPGDMFANTSHVIELKSQLVVIDGQFFAQYGKELRTLTDGLRKPVTRFYITHDHPDHFVGFGDAFPDVRVYALKETRDAIDRDGQSVLEVRQKSLGPLIPSKLNKPSVIVTPGAETIEGVNFVFEKSTDNEAPVSLVVKLPHLGIYIAQDIVYNHAHLFIAGPTQGWKNVLTQIKNETDYDLILPGHGNPVGRAVLDENLAYLNKVDELLKSSKTKEEYKAGILAAYPDYAAAGLIDIYLPILYP